MVHWEKQDKRKAGSSPGPRAGCWAAMPPCPTRTSWLLFRQGGTGPLLTATRGPPRLPTRLPPWLAYVRQQMDPVPSRLAWGWHWRCLQIPRLLTVLVILSTRGGAGGVAWQGPSTGGLPWSRWPSGMSQLSPRHQWGRNREGRIGRLHPEPCLALTQLQQSL